MITKRWKSYRKSIAKYKKTGKFTYRGKGSVKGSGHAAGESWGAKKEIDPHSRVRKYSKNSPSFDEGVYKYKQGAMSRALSNKSK